MTVEQLRHILNQYDKNDTVELTGYIFRGIGSATLYVGYNDIMHETIKPERKEDNCCD